MDLTFIFGRVVRKSNRLRSAILSRRRAAARNVRPMVSFSFDDFPRSSAQEGAAILESYNARGTYYISASLLDQDTPTGQICGREDIIALHRTGHEIGCHTFYHSNAWLTPAAVFSDSLERNASAIQSILPGHKFETLSYPIDTPHPRNKRVASHHFKGCRGGGQQFNPKVLDLNCLRSFFLEKVAGNIDPIKSLVDRNNAANGWLIFSTHDISRTPTPYGCTPDFFESVVRHVRRSQVEILPVSAALDRCLNNTESAASECPR